MQGPVACPSICPAPGADHPFAPIIGVRHWKHWLRTPVGGIWHCRTRRPEAEKTGFLDARRRKDPPEIAEECKGQRALVRHLAARKREVQGQRRLPI